MPWRKRYDDDLSMQEKGQRAYEVSDADRTGATAADEQIWGM